MISLNGKKLLILEKDGEWVNYPYITGFLHQDCLNLYLKMKNRIDEPIEKVVDEEQCAIIYNINNRTIIGYLPKNISDEQLYQLELFSTNCLDDIKYMEIKKVDSDNKDFIFKDN